MEEEARNYDPFGKGGGGAPMRDQHGNVICELGNLFWTLHISFNIFNEC